MQSVHADIDIFETLMALNLNTDILSADDSYKVFLTNISYIYIFYLNGVILKLLVDKVTKRMQKVRGVKLCTGLFTVMNNRTSTVVLMVLTTSKSHDCLLPSLRQMNTVRESLGFKRLPYLPSLTSIVMTGCLVLSQAGSSIRGQPGSR